MKIIVSPAKKMKIDRDSFNYRNLPVFIEETKLIKEHLKELTFDELKHMWKTSDKLTNENFKRLHSMDLTKQLTPAILAYEGIQYQYMAPDVFETEMIEYIHNHLRIISGFYGVLRPFDGVIPYRLEMQAKINIDHTKNLYDFWHDKIYQEVMDDSRTIINLASMEYSRCVSNYLKQDDRMFNLFFGEIQDGRFIQKATYAKMARGEMVRYLAKNHIQDIEYVKQFDSLGYRFDENRSTSHDYYFIK